MNIKTKITVLASVFVALFMGVSLTGTPVAAQTDTRAISDMCPDGLIYNLTSKKCERITETRDPNRNGSSVTCPSGYQTYFDKCVKTEATTVQPCPADEIGRGSGKPGCWKKSNAQGCSYPSTYNAPTNTTGKDDQCWTAGRQTTQTPTSGEQNYLAQCKASGKSDADCKTALDSNKTGCQRAVNDNTYKNMDECLNRRASYDYGQCSDGSKPSISTGKCANGDNPTSPASNNNNNNPGTGGGSSVNADGGECGGAKTAIISCNGKTGEDAIAEILRQFIFILSVGVGIVAVGGIVFGAVLYSSARDNASQTQQAIGIIRNTVIGIVLYVFMVSIVNWLVPGGVIGT